MGRSHESSEWIWVHSWPGIGHLMKSRSNVSTAAGANPFDCWTDSNSVSCNIETNLPTEENWGNPSSSFLVWRNQQFHFEQNHHSHQVVCGPWLLIPWIQHRVHCQFGSTASIETKEWVNATNPNWYEFWKLWLTKNGSRFVRFLVKLERNSWFRYTVGESVLALTSRRDPSDKDDKVPSDRFICSVLSVSMNFTCLSCALLFPITLVRTISVIFCCQVYRK